MVNGLTVVHQGSSGVAMASAPDVCKTPSSAGPVPLPYPNVARSADLANGTTTVLVAGRSVAVEGCNFSTSTGDEPGSVGGVVSGVTKGKAKFTNYSFDVKIEGHCACRLSDPMTMNGNAAQTMTLGETQPPNMPPTDPKCAKIYQIIFEIIWAVRPETPPGGLPQGYQGLAKRWAEFAENVGNFGRKPSGELGRFAENHLKEYKKHQQRLSDKIQEWKDNKCDDTGGDGLRPLKAREYATQQPELGPGKPVEPAIDPALYQAAAGVGVGIIILIVVSRIIRLFPPLLPLELSPI
jgi:hypothetical protein